MLCVYVCAVFVQLDEPLWLPRVREREVAVEILSLCVQLDCVLVSTMVSTRSNTGRGCGFNSPLNPGCTQHEDSIRGVG